MHAFPTCNWFFLDLIHFHHKYIHQIGYLFGQYKRIVGAYENGVLTGKGLSYGGSLIRPEATGYGATYYAVEMLKHFGEEIKGKTFALSGFGNVSWAI